MDVLSNVLSVTSLATSALGSREFVAPWAILIEAPKESAVHIVRRGTTWLLEQKGIPNYMDLWGYDVAHDWPWWRKQIVFFMEHLVQGKSPWPNVKLT